MNDGTVSNSDTVTITTLNTVPVADAGADQSGPVGVTINLDGLGSSDADGDALTYAWTLTSKPANSNTSLVDAASATPSVQIDYPGTYVVQLVVNDGTVNSPIDTMTITTINSKPVADAGDDAEYYAGQPITLDPAGSSDADFDPLSFSWSILSKPAAAPVVDLVPGEDGKVSFRALVVGQYVAQLIANDGTVDGDPDTVVIDVVEPIAVLSAAPLVGAAPLEVQVAAQMVGGFGPYTYVWDNGVTLDAFTRVLSEPGSYELSVTVTDSVGFTATATETVVVKVAPTVDADGAPLIGTSPLTVNFSAAATDADGTIALYQWDFQDDGTFDTSDANSAVTSFTYTTPGLYTARLRVTDNDGLSTDDTVIVTVGEPPILDASVTPLVGTAPLDVTFAASATDSDGTIVRYEWDFESDGVVDFSNTTDGNTTYTYAEGGVFNATARVFDNDGLLAERSFIVSVSGPPVALPRAYPLSGKAPLTVTFFASGSDFDGSPEYYDWDYNGDGNRDIRLIATMNSEYTFTQPGTYQAALTVVDDDQLTDTKYVTITVAPGDATPSMNVTASAQPDNGGAPLDVTLIGRATTESGQITGYSWDFNNDGTPDFTEDATPASLLNQRLDIGSYGSPAPRDVNGDGLVDLVYGNSGGRVYTRLNIGTATFPLFDTTETTLLLGSPDPVDPNQFVIPLECLEVDVNLAQCIVDNGGQIPPQCLESDLPIDLCILQAAGPSREECELQELPPEACLFGVEAAAGAQSTFDVGSYSTPVYYDLNGDGVDDLLVGNSSGILRQLINTATDLEPIWEDQGNLVLDTGGTFDVGSYANAQPYDYDGDGDLDLVVGNSTGQLLVLFKSGTSAQPIWTADPNGRIQDAAATVIDIGSYAAPTFKDMDGDGLLDMLIGNSSGYLFNYLNTGTSTAPIWTSQGRVLNSNGSGIDIGSYFNMAEFDYDGNPATMEALVMNSSGYVAFYQINGTNLFDFILYYDEIDVGGYAAPALVNIDGDTDFDLVIGNQIGQLYLATNNIDETQFAARQNGLIRDNTGATIDVGNHANPAAFDLDADLDPDFIVGNSSGRLFLVRNVGTPTVASFEAPVEILLNGTGSPIDVGSYAAPTFMDVDANGVMDLVVGNSGGVLRILPNSGTNAAPIFGQPINVTDRNGATIDVGSYASPVAFDYDSDGAVELFIGNSTGLVSLYENAIGNTLKLYQENSNYLNRDVGSYARPTVADLDADGDVDMLVGISNGVLYQYYTRGQIIVTYTDPGTYIAAFTATHSDGTSETVQVPITVYPAGTPTAYLVSNVVEGKGPLSVTFNFDGYDPDGVVSNMALDIDSDGTPEVEQATGGTYTHLYETAGTQTATLIVTDNEGKTSTGTTDILVLPNLSTNIATVSFNPLTGGTSVVETTLLAAEGLMTVDIVDGAGDLVRRLVSGVQRGNGTFQDPWDGRNDAGQIVKDDAYYVVVTVVVNGEEIVFDARSEAVFEELTPSRSWSSTFNPYLGQAVAVGYQVPWPAEVTLYFWTRDNSRAASTIAPVRTVFLRLPREAGSYTDYWDGFNDQGVAVDPGQQYPVTLWLYRLPPNAIIITGNTPEITAIDLNPRYFNPAFNPYGSEGAITADLAVTIDKPATLVVDILNEEGLSVRRITAENRASGANIVAWDGRDSEGLLVAPGTYSMGVVAVDTNGNRSLPRYAATTVRY